MARKDANPGAKEAKNARRQAAWEYRKAGMSVRAIAVKLDVAHSTIVADLKAINEEVHAKTIRDASHEQLLALERYEMLLLSVVPNAIKGDAKAVKNGRELVDSIVKLRGLAEPAKTAMTITDGKPAWQPFDLRKLKNLTAAQLDTLEELVQAMNAEPELDDEDEEGDE